MVLVGPETYQIDLILTETRWEMFHLETSNESSLIYPEFNFAGQKAQIQGPDGQGLDKNWLIDGRDDEVPSGRIYRITFEDHLEKHIRWQVLGQDVAPKPLGNGYAHKWYCVGTLSKWTVGAPMQLNQDEFFEATLELGSQGVEEFQILRDRDWLQCVYPAMHGAQDTKIPILGPDAGGAGRNFVVVGNAGASATIRLRVAGELSVSIILDEERVWKRVQFPPRPTYWVTGNCNNWNFSKLLHDEKVPGVFRHRFVMKAGQSGEFKVVKNADADFELYEGELDEVLGEVFEITLDLNHDDRSRVLTWRIVAQGPGLQRNVERTF